jgi:hypothetical protein
MPDTASPTFTHPAGTTKEHPVPDDLYQRYQAAHRAHQTHAKTCTSCTNHARCREGARLWESFERLQDAYLQRKRPR